MTAAAKTELGLGDLEHILAPFDLRPRRVRPLALGTINSNFRVDTDGGALFVRVNEGKSEADVRYEAALLWHLGARRFPTPQPLRRGDARPFSAHGSKWVTAFPWVAGEVLDGARITPSHCEAIGASLGGLHRVGADFPERREGIYTFERVVRRIDAFRGDPRLAEILPALDEEISFVRTGRSPDLPSGTIHGDLFPDNALWRGPRLAAVLDFEQASFGRYAYDLAVTLLAWCWSGVDLDGARVRALSVGYRRERPIDPLEREGLFVEARVAALRFTVTRITDVYLTGMARDGKDFRDYLARLVRLRELGRSGLDALLGL